MKSLMPYAAAAVAAAVAGWFAGGNSSGLISPEVAVVAGDKETIGVTQRNIATEEWMAALPAVRTVPGSASETAWIQWAMAISDADIPAAVASLNPLSDFKVLGFLYSRWVKLDPQAAWAAFRQSTIPADATNFFLPNIGEDEDAFVSYRLTSHPRDNIVEMMLHAWMATDSAACLAFVKQLEDYHSAVSKEVGAQYYILERIKASNSGDGQAEARSSLAEAAKQAAAHRGGRVVSDEFCGALLKWLKHDTRAACLWMKELPPETRKELDFNDLEYYMELTPAKLRMETTMALLEGRERLSDQNMMDVSRELEDLQGPGIDERGIFLAAKSIREWAGEDSVAARAYVNALPEGNLRTLLTGQLAGELVKTDANAAIALVNQVEGEQRYALAGLVNGWVQQDSAACLAWLGKINDPEFTNTSYATVAERLSTAQPTVAVETALKITDPAMRRNSLEQIKRNLNWNPALVNRLAEAHPEVGWK